MLGLIRQLRQDRMMGKAMRISQKHLGLINEAHAAWTDAMVRRRISMEDFFDERLVSVVPVDDLSFEHMAELEAVAMMSNWAERTGDRTREFTAMLSDDTCAAVHLLNIGDEINERTVAVIREQHNLLDAYATRAIREAVVRRGETPAPTRD